MNKLTGVAILSGALMLMAGTAFATPTGGTTLAGGSNGAGARMSSTRHRMMMHGRSGAPSAMGRGQGTEHMDGKMRAHKNF